MLLNFSYHRYLQPKLLLCKQSQKTNQEGTDCEVNQILREIKFSKFCVTKWQQFEHPRASFLPNLIEFTQIKIQRFCNSQNGGILKFKITMISRKIWVIREFCKLPHCGTPTTGVVHYYLRVPVIIGSMCHIWQHNVQKVVTRFCAARFFVGRPSIFSSNRDKIILLDKIGAKMSLFWFYRGMTYWD